MILRYKCDSFKKKFRRGGGGGENVELTKKVKCIAKMINQKA